MVPAFVITVSSPVTTAFDQELYRVKSGMKAAGFGESDMEQAHGYYLSLKRLIDQKEPYEKFSELQMMVNETKWVDHVITGDQVVYKYLSIVFGDDKAPNLRTLTCPLLAIWGKNDLVVPPLSSSKVYEQELREIGNTNVQIKVIPSADHTMTYNLTGLGSETRKRREDFKSSPGEIFAPGYISMMSEWLRSLY